MSVDRRPTRYRERVVDIVARQLSGLAVTRALDFGAGDGWIGAQLQSRRVIDVHVPVDVQVRAASLRAPILFDGQRLPFSDRRFDLVFAVDVIHHCARPEAALAEMARCSSRYLLLKDHTFVTSTQRAILRLLDEVGNRRFRVPSPGHYQRGWEWDVHLQANGFERVSLVWPARVHVGLLGMLTNQLQFVSLWRRRAA